MRTSRVIKWIALSLPVLLLVAVSFVIISSYLEHRELVEQEMENYPAPGVLVDVNGDGKKLHVYTKGEGAETLVFMSGLGTPSPVYDFSVLYDRLSEDYRIAVVERAGYGWSNITAGPRNIDTVLEETRKALELAGEGPPYVLFPHSMAGLESVYWASLYPQEVQAIIGLDALVPGYIEQAEEGPSLSPAITFLTRTGLVRTQPGVFEKNFHAMRKGHLSAEEAEVARTIFFRRVQTKNMYQEVEALRTNDRIVSAQGKPDVPFHAFVSSRNEDPQWMESITSYAEATGGDSFVLDGDHYIHLDYPEIISEKSREIIVKAREE